MQGGVKAAAALSPGESQAHGAGSLKHQLQPHPPHHDGTTWYERQERQAQLDEPAGGASTSAPPAQQPAHKERGVKFAAVHVEAGSSSGSGNHWDAGQGPAQQPLQHGDADGSSMSVAPRTGFFSFSSRAKRTAQDDAGGSLNGSGTSFSQKAAGSGLGWGVASRAVSQASMAAPGSEVASRAASVAVAPSGMSATLKGLFGGASSRLLGGLMGRGSGSAKGDGSGAAAEEEELWFSSLDDFKPICHMLHRGRSMAAYFACAHKTGQHFLLKKFDKHKMLPAEERGVRRSIAFSELLQHPNLVRLMGTWESEEFIFVVEEYVGKGDILNDCISHPDKYTERHVAVALVKPLLRVLAHLHANNVVHRSVLPENAYMGLDDVLRLGHLTLAVDQSSDRPRSRTTLLDYMAPEMLSVRAHDEHELALLDSDEDEGGDNASGGGGGGGGGGPQACGSAAATQQQQQQAAWPPQQLGLLGRVTAAAGDLDGSGSSSVLLLTADGCSSGGAAAAAAAGPPQQQQQQRRVAAQLEASRQGSLELLLEGADAASTAAVAGAGQQRQAGCSSSGGGQVQAAPSSPGGVSARQRRAAAAAGRAAWEQRDCYDEKVDVWQVGCLVHELLCGNMPFELDCKLDSAGLALWADIEALPGSLPPDCADFVGQALTKDPRLRPSALALLQHPWLARCEAGEPWRDFAELEAARREAELATVSGWLRHKWAAGSAAVTAAWQLASRGSRVAPVQGNSSSSSGAPTNQQQPRGHHGSSRGSIDQQQQQQGHRGSTRHKQEQQQPAWQEAGG